MKTWPLAQLRNASRPNERNRNCLVRAFLRVKVLFFSFSGEKKKICYLSVQILEDDVVLDPSGASGSPAEELWPNSNGAAHHYDVASAWMDNDAANEELHRYSEP